MDSQEFLRKLFILFPPETSYQETLEFYIEAFDDGKDYDYRRLLRIISREYIYKTLPSTSWLLDKRQICLIPSQGSYSGQEGQTIVRTINGFPYNFTIVPNHWQRVKTISKLDNEIAERT